LTMSIKRLRDDLAKTDRLILAMERRGLIPRMSDEEYIRRMWRVKMDYPLDLENPKTFNEKLQWLKLHDRRPEYTTMVDKVKAKEYVAGIIGEEHIIPTLGEWDDPNEIDFDALPNQFVLKCNHNSGLGMCICKDKSKLDIEKVKAELRKGLKQDYYLTFREWPYKKVARKILAEQYLEDKTQNNGLIDYKFFCFNGEPKLLFVATERFSEGGTKEDFFDLEWNYLHLTEIPCAHSEMKIEKPHNLSAMILFSKKLSVGIPHIRVDFYEIGGKIYFGELTFANAAGFCRYEPRNWDYMMGDWLELPRKI